MKRYGLVGEKLSHSFSPEIHKRFGYGYELIEVPKSEIDSFFERRDFAAVNVTIPYKETVIPHLDHIDGAAREIGAVNTVVNRDGKLYGYNTDAAGMTAAMMRAGIVPNGKKALICGTGGTSKTAAYVLKNLGAKETVFLSRSGKDGCATYEEAYRLHTDAGVIVNTTPCGMYPNADGCPIDISRFPRLEGVFDAVFNPIRTRLVLEAGRRGVAACGGLYMLVFQAVKASELFTGRGCSKGLADAVYGDLVRSKENVVLIGMPSSGKSSVGRRVAELLGRDLADTDDEIRRITGRSPAEIIRADGEARFREIESGAVRTVSSLRGMVIATGGGAVLREENVTALKANGRVYFLDRDPDRLTATGDRPLSSDRESLLRLYGERIDVYRSVCDVLTDSNGSVEDAARAVCEEFKERDL